MKRTITRVDSLKSKGEINEEKNHKIMRIFAVNPNIFRPESFKKIKQMREAYQNYSFDICLFSLLDR